MCRTISWRRNLKRFLNKASLDQYVEFVTRPHLLVDFERNALAFGGTLYWFEVIADFIHGLDDGSCGGTGDKHLVTHMKVGILNQELSNTDIAEVFPTFE